MTWSPGSVPGADLGRPRPLLGLGLEYQEFLGGIPSIPRSPPRSSSELASPPLWGTCVAGHPSPLLLGGLAFYPRYHQEKSATSNDHPESWPTMCTFWGQR